MKKQRNSDTLEILDIRFTWRKRYGSNERDLFLTSRYKLNGVVTNDCALVMNPEE